MLQQDYTIHDFLAVKGIDILEEGIIAITVELINSSLIFRIPYLFAFEWFQQKSISSEMESYIKNDFNYIEALSLAKFAYNNYKNLFTIIQL